MDDLIRRQKAIETLEEPCKVPDTWTDEYAIGERAQWEKDVKALNSLPSAQPEIIRCKDCKHRFVDGENVRFNVCELNHNKVQADDWFCADAERRTDE